MNKRTVILINILILAILLKLSIWADQKAVETRGPTRIIPGPQGSLYLLMDDQIIKTSSEGDILSSFDLASMGIREPVADFSVEPDGQILVGLMDSQEIHRYSKEGQSLGTIPRPPSPMRMGVPGQPEWNFKFTRDPATGFLYVADSNHHRIQIYGPDMKEISVLTAPSNRHASPHDANSDSDAINRPELDPDRNFLFPNALAVDGDRFYATDTDNHRIVEFRLDGAFEKIIPTVKDRRTPYIFPVHFSRLGQTLYVVNRGPHFIGGEVIGIDLLTGQWRRLYPDGLLIDPLDILAREDEVLIADGETKNILRYSAEGYYFGFFGKPPLQGIMARQATVHGNYRFTRILSLGGMVLVLLVFLVMKRLERKERESQGLPSVHRPLAALQDFLGPAGSTRRIILLALLPGLGQIAAGRILRAIILLPPLLFLAMLFAVSVFLLLFQGVTLLSVVMFVGIVTAAYWTGVVLDGIRLNEGSTRPPKKFDFLNSLVTLGFPLITVLAGAAGQLIWEIMRQVDPEISLAVQKFFGDTMLRLSLESEHTVVFAAMTPAGRFLGWGGAVAGMFGALGWRLQLSRGRTTAAVFVGFFVGMLSWIFTATFPGSMLGGAYYMPLSQGLLISLVAYLLFRGTHVSPAVIPLGIAAAWIGNMIHLFWHFDLPFKALPGASIRITSIVYEAYFIHLAVLILINARERARQSIQPGAPPAAVNPEVE